MGLPYLSKPLEFAVWLSAYVPNAALFCQFVSIGFEFEFIDG